MSRFIYYIYIFITNLKYEFIYIKFKKSLYHLNSNFVTLLFIMITQIILSNNRIHCISQYSLKNIILIFTIVFSIIYIIYLNKDLYSIQKNCLLNII